MEIRGMKNCLVIENTTYSQFVRILNMIDKHCQKGNYGVVQRLVRRLSNTNFTSISGNSAEVIGLYLDNGGTLFGSMELVYTSLREDNET